MNYSTHIKIIFGAVLCCVVLAYMPGCSLSPDKVKDEADSDVYNIIGSKWDKDFGEKTNFKVSDTEPSDNAIQIERAIPESGVLGLEHAVSLATAHNRQYQTEKENLYQQALDLRLIRHRYEPNLFSRSAGGYSRQGDNAGYGAEGNIGFNQLLATGAQISTKVALGWVSLIRGDYEDGFSRILSVAISQPLLRGSGRAVALEELTQAERDTLYEIRTFNRFRKTFVVDIIGRYYRILELGDNVKDSEENYRALTKIYRRMETLTEAGKLPRHELQQAHQDRLNALDIYGQAKKSHQQALDEFKMTLSLPTTMVMELEKEELNILIASGVPKLDFDEEDAIKTALSMRLDLANVADSVLDAERKVMVAEDGLRAELNLVGIANPNIANRTDFGALTGALRDSEDRYLLIAELDLPLDRMAEKTAYRKSLTNLIQGQRKHEEATDMVALEVRQAYRSLKEARERYLVQSHSLELAQRRVDNTFLLLQYSSQGNRRANARDVLDAQKDLFNASTDATAALVDYNIAVLEFYRDAGVLEVKPDGMWRKVAAK